MSAPTKERNEEELTAAAAVAAACSPSTGYRCWRPGRGETKKTCRKRNTRESKQILFQQHTKNLEECVSRRLFYYTYRLRPRRGSTDCGKEEEKVAVQIALYSRIGKIFYFSSSSSLTQPPGEQPRRTSAREAGEILCSQRGDAEMQVCWLCVCAGGLE